MARTTNKLGGQKEGLIEFTEKELLYHFPFQGERLMRELAIRISYLCTTCFRFVNGNAQVNIDPQEVEQIPCMSDWMFEALKEKVRTLKELLKKISLQIKKSPLILLIELPFQDQEGFMGLKVYSNFMSNVILQSVMNLEFGPRESSRGSSILSRPILTIWGDL